LAQRQCESFVIGQLKRIESERPFGGEAKQFARLAAQPDRADVFTKTERWRSTQDPIAGALLSA
jgi:hypothetical protein